MLASSTWAIPPTDSPRRQSRDPRLLDRQPGAPECEWSQHPASSRATAGMPTVVQDNGVGGRSGRETQMDWNIIEGKWKELKGHAREQWGKLVVAELAPLFARMAFELFPPALDDVPVHLRLPPEGQPCPGASSPISCPSKDVHDGIMRRS